MRWHVTKHTQLKLGLTSCGILLACYSTLSSIGAIAFARGADLHVKI